MAATPAAVVMVALVPVRLAAAVAAVTACAVPDVVLDVNVTVAIPLEFVVDVAALNEPPPVDVHVTTLPLVARALLFASAT